MREKEIKTMIKEALNIPSAVVENMKRTPGGLTNKSYFATVNGEKIVVRIPGKGTEELVDREAEKNNLTYATKLGINPELIYFDATSGLKITQKIDNPTTMTPALARERSTVKRIIALFQHLHSASEPMKSRFELFQLIKHYEKLVSETNPLMNEKLAPIRSDIEQLKSVYQMIPVTVVPCHIDAACSNILFGGQNADELFLIDWEYSGMFDPMWDIATLFLSFDFTDEEEHFFLKYYLEREAEPVELQRILLHKIFQDYLWGLWSFYKNAKGDDTGADAIYRVGRAKKHISIYKTIFEEDVVV